MIRTLNAPFLKEWNALQPFQPATYSSSGCRRSFVATPYKLIRPYSPPPLVRTSVLYYSTVSDKINLKTNPAVLPPSKTVSNKLKVDLRPAPKKVGHEPSSTITISHPPPAIQLKSTSSPRPTVQPIASGIVDTARYDISEATKHGIIKPPPEGAGRVQRLWHQAKQLFLFYWGGLKMIFVTHRRQVNEIRRRVAQAKASGQDSVLSRWETKFIQTYNKDLVKLLPFILTVLIAEEALPLVVLYAPGLLPSTCLLPTQRERIATKRRAQQILHLEAVRAELLRLGQRAESSTNIGVNSLNIVLARSISGALLRPTWGPLSLQQHRIKKRLAYLSSDDAMLVKEDYGTRLKEEELLEVLEERGLIPDSRTPQHMREQLKWWLRGAIDDRARLRLVLQAASRRNEGIVKTETL